MPQYAHKTLRIHADYITWDVWQNNSGNILLQNYITAPAANATVHNTSGNGSLSDVDAYWQLDSTGDGTVIYTMGTEIDVVNSTVSYFQSVGTATLEFDPPFDTSTGSDNSQLDNGNAATPTGATNWHFDHVAGTIAPEFLGPYDGDQRLVCFSIHYKSWEVWVDDLGNADARNISYSPALGAVASFGIQSGDGSFSRADSTTDSLGYVFAKLDGNSVETTAYVTASFMGATTSATWFIPAPVTDNGNSNTTTGGNDNGDGNTNTGGNDNGNGNTTTGGNDNGNGNTTGGVDSEDGNTTTGDNDNGNGNATNNGTTSDAPWVFARYDGEISASLGSSGILVNYSTWAVWHNQSTGADEVRSSSTGTASGACVNWSTSGGVSIYSSISYTDANGSAAVTVTTGETDGTLYASVSFTDANGIGHSTSASTTIAGSGNGNNNGNGGTGVNNGDGTNNVNNDGGTTSAPTEVNRHPGFSQYSICTGVSTSWTCVGTLSNGVVLWNYEMSWGYRWYTVLWIDITYSDGSVKRQYVSATGMPIGYDDVDEGDGQGDLIYDDTGGASGTYEQLPGTTNPQTNNMNGPAFVTPTPPPPVPPGFTI